MSLHITIGAPRLDELIAQHQVVTWDDELHLARQVAEDAGYEYQGDEKPTPTDNIVYDLAHTIVRLADTIHKMETAAARSLEDVTA